MRELARTAADGESDKRAQLRRKCEGPTWCKTCQAPITAAKQLNRCMNSSCGLFSSTWCVSCEPRQLEEAGQLTNSSKCLQGTVV